MSSGCGGVEKDDDKKMEASLITSKPACAKTAHLLTIKHVGCRHFLTACYSFRRLFLAIQGTHGVQLGGGNVTETKVKTQVDHSRP